MKRRHIRELSAHPVSRSKYLKVQASVKDQSLDAQTEQEKDMIYSIVDLLAKRSLMKKKGSYELWRYVVNDEMRWGPDSMFPKGKSKVLVKVPAGEDPPRRAYIPFAVPLSFNAITVICSVALDGSKLRPLLICNKKNETKVHIPTREELTDVPDNVQVHEPSCIVAHSQRNWNTAEIHSNQYLKQIILPHFDAHKPIGPQTPVREQEPSPPLRSPPLRPPHVPQNPFVGGSFSNKPFPAGGEIHDTFRGHTARLTIAEYTAAGVFTNVVAAHCTGFMQWNDKYLHHVSFRRLRRGAINH